MSSIPNINPSYHADRPQVIGRIGQKNTLDATAAAIAAETTAKTDSVEISTEALAASATTDTARAHRIAQIKAQIQAGTYGEDDKLAFAADRIAKALSKG